MGQHKDDSAVITRSNKKVKRPKRYKVILFNDDYTSMEFVVFVLQSVFHKSLEEANRLMLEIHTQGSGVCGVLTYESAEMKVNAVTELALANEYPLRCEMEEE